MYLNWMWLHYHKELPNLEFLNIELPTLIGNRLCRIWIIKQSNDIINNHGPGSLLGSAAPRYDWAQLPSISQWWHNPHPKGKEWFNFFQAEVGSACMLNWNACALFTLPVVQNAWSDFAQRGRNQGAFLHFVAF